LLSGFKRRPIGNIFRQNVGFNTIFVYDYLRYLCFMALKVFHNTFTYRCAASLKKILHWFNFKIIESWKLSGIKKSMRGSQKSSWGNNSGLEKEITIYWSYIINFEQLTAEINDNIISQKEVLNNKYYSGINLY
jgi:hypothetical protein